MPLVKSNLAGVNPILVTVVGAAYGLLESRGSSVLFKVTEGVRSAARQKQLFDAGASQTLNGRHMTGHAVDLAALINGKVSYDWPLYFTLAEAMQEAAYNHNVQLVWGGVWDKPMDAYIDCGEEHYAYINRKRAAGVKRVFVDGPHFELSRARYPA